MVRAFLVSMVAVLAVGGCTTRPPEAVAALTPTGEAVNCLLVQNIRETRVIDDQTIDFYTRNGDVYRNRLPNGCPQLGFERAFSYQTSVNQLCNVDIITVLMTTSPLQRGASCGLGKFTPIAKPAP
ncbi:hypothetical protein GCM10007973_24350 [Polymorphobacter multimanifer]|uniref:Lipoprotein n=1 Tax=Polymorphobacter multimanifer TaxID=1070431 RepID=A0A841LCI3_9SPHN|nr:DUF6491 family protein [Polymorphobacter multimanifer]MBB6228703.1 hypothetical protein [Polymorphobacter multimanifer]GGI87047.1 hypothetical protein GCM10007973_24350 [Polymorphobacter multimanifer]